METFACLVREDYACGARLRVCRLIPPTGKIVCLGLFSLPIFWSWLLLSDTALRLGKRRLMHTTQSIYVHLCLVRVGAHKRTDIASVTLKGFFPPHAKKTSFRVHFVFPYWLWLAFASVRLLKSISFSVNMHISQWAWVNPRPPAAETEGKTRIDNFRLPARRLHRLHHRSSHDWESIHDSLLFGIYVLYVQYTYVWVCVFIYIYSIYIYKGSMIVTARKNWIKLTKILIKGPYMQKCADLCDITKGTDSRPKSVTTTRCWLRPLRPPYDSKWAPTKRLL